MTMVLLVDDSALWIKQGRDLLGKADYEVNGLVVSDPKKFISESLPQAVAEALEGVDVLLIDKDLGENITSTRLICVIRHNFPELPIIRWTGGWDQKPHMTWLRVSTLAKPNRNREGVFVAEFEKMLEEQKVILSGPMGIFANLDEVVKPDQHAIDRRAERLQEIAEIAQLAEKDWVPRGDGRYEWGIVGRAGGETKHELGHCICDGVLTADDIRPHLPALQKVIEKFEDAGEIDDRFRCCAEFIKDGNLDELELVHRCY